MEQTNNVDLVTALALKQVLWETIQGLRDKTLKVENANAIAKTANAILKTISLECEVVKQYGLQSSSLKGFIECNSSAKPLPPDTDVYTNKVLKDSNKEPATV